MTTAPKKPLPALALSLQFVGLEDAALHRQALARHRVSRWLRHALESDAEITVRVVGQAEGQRLNRDYRQRDYATNVLTFGYAQAPQVLADLVLCAPVAAAEAQAAGISLQAHYAHLLVHAALHAQGWDHETDEAQALAMEAYERQILAALGQADPYAERSRQAPQTG